MSDGQSASILVVTSLDGASDRSRNERGLREVLAEGVTHVVPCAVLKANMESFLRQVRDIISVGSDSIGGFEIDQVEVAAQISGDGQVCLVGSGVKVTAGGQVKFVLKRARAG